MQPDPFDTDILPQLQNWINKIPVVVIGSGASVPYGLPGMWELGEYLKEKVVFDTDEENVIAQEFKRKLEVSNDLEMSLSDLSLPPAVLSKIIQCTWALVNERDLQAYGEILSSRTSVSPLARLIEYLVDTSRQKLTVVTTNYDRLVEIAASAVNSFICTGFAFSYLGKSNKAHQSFETKDLRGFSGQINIWKVHGSLDWFKGPDDIVYHIPMQRDIPAGYSPEIVTPGLKKYEITHLEPYRTIISEADKAIEKAASFLCIGYGFNDSHVQAKLMAEISRGKPIVVITKKLSGNAKREIVDKGCSNYILIEEGESPSETLVHASGGKIYKLENCQLWQLGEFNNKIIF